MGTILTENQQAALKRAMRKDPGTKIIALDPWENGLVAVVTLRSDGKVYVIKPNGFTRRTRCLRLPEAIAA